MSPLAGSVAQALVKGNPLLRGPPRVCESAALKDGTRESEARCWGLDLNLQQRHTAAEPGQGEAQHF